MNRIGVLSEIYTKELNSLGFFKNDEIFEIISTYINTGQKENIKLIRKIIRKKINESKNLKTRIIDLAIQENKHSKEITTTENEFTKLLSSVNLTHNKEDGLDIYRDIIIPKAKEDTQKQDEDGLSSKINEIIEDAIQGVIITLESIRSLKTLRDF